jgi:uncharacterized protein (TIGR02453 family)
MPSFFRGLEKNNTREWFTPRKAVFDEHVRGPMVELVGLINEDLKRFAVDNALAVPAKAIYRIYRDTRFSKDKTPYKTHIGATFGRKGLPKHRGAGFYFGVSHKHVEIAGGIYMPEPPELAAVRRAIAEDHKKFLKLIGEKKLARVMGKLQGERLARSPKGFEDHAGSPAAQWLPFKQWYWYVLLPAEVALSPRIRKAVVERFALMADAIDWMNRAVLAGMAAEADEEAIPKRPEPMW